MLDRSQVFADVVLTMRDVVVKYTPYTLKDPDADKSGFRFTLVPKAKLWKGWNATMRGWENDLSRIVQALHDKRPEYAVLSVNVKDIDKTRGAPLSTTRTLLFEKIVAGISDLRADEKDASDDNE